jgi:hypothetical protein
MTFKSILKSMLVSIIEKVMEVSPTLKECVAEAEANIKSNNPFIEKSSGMSNPCNEIPVGEARASVIDKDYGKLKAPAKKHFIN